MKASNSRLQELETIIAREAREFIYFFFFFFFFLGGVVEHFGGGQERNLGGSRFFDPPQMGGGGSRKTALTPMLGRAIIIVCASQHKAQETIATVEGAHEKELDALHVFAPKMAASCSYAVKLFEVSTATLSMIFVRHNTKRNNKSSERRKRE